jgi:hypothetical protein
VDATVANGEFVSGRLFRKLGHAIEMNEEGDKDLVCGWTIVGGGRIRGRLRARCGHQIKDKGEKR